jgi:hypothetical protein
MTDAPDAVDGDRVEDLIHDRIDGDIETILWYRSCAETHYALVAALTDDDRLSLTTVILDVDDETVRIHGDNSMWLPAEPDILDGVIRSVARSLNAATDSIEDDEPMRDSLVTFAADEIGGYVVEDDYDPGDSDWKADEGADEMDTVHERLEDSPIETADRMIRLEFGRKRPWEGEPQRIMHSPDEVGGTYGVEVSEDDDLVILDVDDMETAPLDSMPDTLRSESPHGGEHRFYHVPGWQAVFNDRFGLDNPHPSYGEVRSQDGYVVGPGARLTDCKHGCCTEDSPGEYVLDDAPIATVAAEAFADLIEPFRGDDG